MNSVVPPLPDSNLSTTDLSSPSISTPPSPSTNNTTTITSAAEESLSVSWQKEFSLFLGAIGLDETKQCFDTELLVLSRYHQSQLPQALESLVERLLLALEQHVNAEEELLLDPSEESSKSKDLLYPKKRKRQTYDTESDDKTDIKNDDTKMDYEALAKSMDPEQVQIRASNRQVQQRINTYIQAKQHDVDASNRAEFLNRSDPKGEDVTCARADAREINRNIQMKFDIVNNEDGPLARSLVSSSATKVQQQPQQPTTADMEERLGNLEAHLNVKFEQHPTQPFTCMERIKILESTLIDIEKKYPTWAAVHFNQPNRTYPPPPPLTFITRPTQQSPTTITTNNNNNTDTSATISMPTISSPTSSSSNDNYVASQIIPSTSKQSSSSSSSSTLRLTGRSNSSLTRAVMEQLQRQRQLEEQQSTGT
ncbi:uncharacterized protein BX664DRAFT_341383 [Halteromyces radiatus]|uniref:uncharacterized protein n=1 Tax=Halteromyces radiatus TaxID=101107 RepID=UPI00221EB2CA|nr:uncharacterized protein BX664DRAFT_341383 [Halteromyces radiatus]KAI8079751.1 hypothetical protein BX664DRAFT_341383 [Halteromyces radiatus]